MARHQTIRDRLEEDAWKHHPHFARNRANLPSRRRTMLRWQDRALLLLAVFLLLLLVIRVETARAGTDPVWGIEVAGAPHSIALDTDIRVEVTGLAARVEVTQRFRNEGPAWKEAVYRFPLPAGAAVDRLRIEVAGRVIEGEIREKEQARRQYEQARSAGQTASLVEQQRPNQFETRLANIAPGEEIRVRIAFLATVDFRDGSFGLQLPLTFTPRYPGPHTMGAVGSESAGDGASANPSSEAWHHNAPQPVLVDRSSSRGHYLTMDIALHSASELASIESRFHDIDIERVNGGYHILLTDPDTRSDRLFELSWTPAFGATAQATVSTWNGGDAVYALLMLAPPLEEAIAPGRREVVFIIDTSGSMEGQSLEQARAALRQGLDYLGPDDRFNLLRFDSDAELLFPESEPPRGVYLEEAMEFIAGLVADGGTNMGPALDLAMELPAQHGLLRQIVFITDGSVGNEEELLLRIGEKLGDSRLFTVAIGSAPNAWFMRKAAEVGRGVYTSIGAQAEVGERMTALWARIENPAVQDLEVDWGMEADFYPEIIPDLYAGEPLWLHARLPFQPREVTVFGALDGRHWQTSSLVNPTPGGEALATLWARSRIEALEDSRIFGTDAEDVRRQVLELALDFGLLTPYPSLVAVDRTPARPAAEGLDSEQVPSLLPAGSATTTGFAQTATGWATQLALALLSLCIATGMLLYLPPSRQDHAGGARQPGLPVSA
jgi:Ca-activated chloride channel family protein